jgi:hypothetical protein
MRSGSRIGEISVDTEVIVTEKATSPRARYVITFDEVPPGHDPTSTTPAASIGSSSNILASANPRNGITPYCATTPTPTSLGLSKTLLKSEVVNVAPIPNIIMPSVGTIRFLKSAKYTGYRYAIAEKSMIQSVKKLVTTLFRSDKYFKGVSF